MVKISCFFADMEEKKIQEETQKNFFYIYSLIFPFLILLLLFVFLIILFIRGSLQWYQQTVYEKMSGNMIPIVSALDVYNQKYHHYPPGQTYAGYTPNNLTTPISFTTMYNDPFHLPKVYNTFQFLDKYLFHIVVLLFIISSFVLLLFEKIQNKEFKGMKLVSGFLFSITSILIILGFTFRVVYPEGVKYENGYIFLLIIAFSLSIIIRAIYGERISESIIGGKTYFLCTLMLIIVPLLFFSIKSITLSLLLKRLEYNTSFYYYTNGDNFYALISVGPDLELTIPFDTLKNIDWSKKVNDEDILKVLNPYVYDPTNGLVSKGDTFNFKLKIKEN